MKEIWKEIECFKGLYEVSSFGNVRSIDKKVVFKDGRIRFYKGKILEKTLNKKRGYYYISLKKNRKTYTFSVHSLVYCTFKKCDKILVIDHIDNNRLNNKLSNLRQITQRENLTKENKGKSTYTGVCFHKRHNKWVSYYYYNKKNYHIGYFNTEKEAYLARIKFIEANA